MALFEYTVFNSSGQKIFGEKEATSREEVVNFLYSQNLTIISVDEKFDLNLKKVANIEIGGIPLAEKLMIVKQLSTMLGAGIPLIHALDILIQQAEKDNVRKKLENVYKLVESGTTLSQAYKKEGGIFSDVQINLLAAGEKSGNLTEMLAQISIDMEKSKNLKNKVLGAMIYPIILFVVMFIVIIVIIVFIIPQYKELYKGIDPNAQLPIFTRALVSLGDFFRNPLNSIISLVVITALIVVFRYYTNTKVGRYNFDRLKLKLPIFGTLNTKINLLQFCRTTSMLLRSGITLLEAVGIVSDSLSNAVFKNILLNSKEEIKKGNAFSLAIAKEDTLKVFPLILLKTLATAEESGKLDKILDDMGKYYEEEVNEMTNSLSKLIEPLVLVVVGGLVALLAVSVYLPMYKVGEYIQ